MYDHEMLSINLKVHVHISYCLVPYIYNYILFDCSMDDKSS